MKYRRFQDYNAALACYLRFRDQLDLTYIDKQTAVLGLKENWDCIKTEKIAEDVFGEY